jgi:hypothetical protein
MAIIILERSKKQLLPLDKEEPFDFVNRLKEHPVKMARKYERMLKRKRKRKRKKIRGDI